MMYSQLMITLPIYICIKLLSNIYTGDIGTKIAIQGSDIYLACPVNILENHNKTILWGRNHSERINFTADTSYSKNMSGLVIHNTTIEHKGYYTCYSEEDSIGYKTKVIVESMVFKARTYNILIVCTVCCRTSTVSDGVCECQ